MYFYHPDHLGSSSLITNADGVVTQHVEYIPFGEVFIEERNKTWNTPYLFNAKELDEETGLYYYGARYLDPKTGVWLSVDPLAEKFVDWSSYSYCFQNPVRYFDPTGMKGEDTSGKPAGTPKLNPVTKKIVGNYTTALSSVYTPIVHKKESIPITLQRALKMAQKRPPETLTRTKTYTEKSYEALSDFDKAAVNSPIIKGVATGAVAGMAYLAAPAVATATTEAATIVGNAATPIVIQTTRLILSNPNVTLSVLGAGSGAAYSLLAGEAQDLPQLTTGLPYFDNAFVGGQAIMTTVEFYKRFGRSNTNNAPQSNESSSPKKNDNEKK